MLYLFIWIWKEDTWTSKTKYYVYVLSMTAALSLWTKTEKGLKIMAKHPFSEVLWEWLPLKEEVCASIWATRDSSVFDSWCFLKYGVDKATETFKDYVLPQTVTETVGS